MKPRFKQGLILVYKSALFKQIPVIILITTLLACSDNVTGQLQTKHEFALPGIYVIDAKFPLTLSNINLKDSQNIIHINDEIVSKISQTLSSFYFDECAGDSNETHLKIKDSYIGTLRLRDSLYTVFLVLLNHVQTGNVNAKVLFYNNTSKEFTSKVFDFNLHALYYLYDGELKPSDLKEKFKINSPEIELIYEGKNRTDNFKFTRLYHNGTANAIETTILKVTNNNVDTLDFKQTWIED